MRMSEAVKSQGARAARVLLVFALVFWCSFRVEAFAFAAMNLSDIAGHADDALTNITVYQVDPHPEKNNKTGLGASLGSAEKGIDDAKVAIEGIDEEVELVAVPSWNGGKPALDSKTGDVEVAQFMKWESGDDKVAKVEIDEKTGVAKVTGVAEGATTITCGLADADDLEGLDVSEFPGEGKATIEFAVEVKETAPSGVSRSVNVMISDADGNFTADRESRLTLPSTAIGSPYRFDAQITVTTIEGTEAPVTYDSVSAARAAGIEVAWSFDEDTDAAQIDAQSGELTFSKEGTAVVRVDVATPEEKGIKKATGFDVVTVKTSGATEPEPGDDPEPTPTKPVSQGDANPQQTLTIVSNARVAATDGSEAGQSGGDESGAGEGDGSSSSASSDGDGAATDAPVDAAQDERGGAETDEEPTAPIEKTYTVSDLEALGMDKATYTMYDGSAFVTVTGEGPDLIAVLHDAGIENTDQIESLTFENADGVATTVTWAELESATRYYPHASAGNFEDAVMVIPKIAVNSLVRGYGDGTGEGDDAASDQGEPGAETGAGGSESSSSSSSAGQGVNSGSSSSAGGALDDAAGDKSAVTNDVALVDNTRFRVLFGSTTTTRAIANPDALRWVNKITVNVKPAEEPPSFDTDIDVSVEYVPVPLGSPAVFSALPNTAIRSARFDFHWQVSTDDGKTWENVPNGNVQVLRVTTTAERLGNQYRVIMETNATDRNGLENVTVTSKPVTMSEGNGLAVVLEYDPPIAGQTAYFKTTLYGERKGVGIAYTWQQSQDGGQTWIDIPGRTGKTLAVPTEPVDPNAEPTDSDADIPITYVRVIAEETSGDKRVAISEAVPLTVHVDDGTSDPGDDPATPGTPGDPGTTDPDPVEPDSDKPHKRKPKVTPVDDIQIEPPSSRQSAATPTVPTDDGTIDEQIDPSQLYINEEVTEAVAEQEEAVEEYIEQTQPGARWTSLSSARASDDDVRNILADNPFAPLVVPTGLGITVAGGLEKLIAFRRQTR